MQMETIPNTDGQKTNKTAIDAAPLVSATIQSREATTFAQLTPYFFSFLTPCRLHNISVSIAGTVSNANFTRDLRIWGSCKHPETSFRHEEQRFQPVVFARSH
jgi:hypothetical protein